MTQDIDPPRTDALGSRGAGCLGGEFDKDTRITPIKLLLSVRRGKKEPQWFVCYLVTTVQILIALSFSTRNSRPIPRVKNPAVRE